MTLHPTKAHTPAGVLTGDQLAAFEAPFRALAQDLEQASAGHSVFFMQNHGNYGDALIRFGTLRFFEDIGLTIRELDMGSRVDKLRALVMGLTPTLFVYSGSGAWSRACEVGYRNVRRQHRLTRNLFILPTTFEIAPSEIAPTLNVPIFVRDTSDSLRHAPQGKFCHDMAFYLATIHPDRVLADRTPASKPVGLILRTDNEARAHGLAKHPANFDLSASGDHRSNPAEFLRYLDQFDHVVTDRLHAAIGAALLGKRVSLAPGNYFKIRAIFESSIKGYFDQVELVDDDGRLRHIVEEAFG